MKTIRGFFKKYRWLSNFYLLQNPIPSEGLYYPSIEHAFQAMKTTNEKHRKMISKMKNPRDAKKFGRLVTIRYKWEEMKLEVMQGLILRKFVFNDDLKEKLLETGSAVLIEENTWKDTFWGTCKGKGENHLGKILMTVRTMILNFKFTREDFDRNLLDDQEYFEHLEELKN